MKSDSNHWRSNTLIQKGIPLKDFAEITQQIMLTLSNIIDFNNISLTEIGLKNLNGYHWNFLESIIRDESTKIVKDEISDFLRRELKNIENLRISTPYDNFIRKRIFKETYFWPYNTLFHFLTELSYGSCKLDCRTF